MEAKQSPPGTSSPTTACLHNRSCTSVVQLTCYSTQPHVRGVAANDGCVSLSTVQLTLITWARGNSINVSSFLPSFLPSSYQT